MLGREAPAGQARFDVFVSYARADSKADISGRRWVEALRDRLVEDFRTFGRPLRVFLDTDEIASMDDWRRRLLVGLRESRVLLACLSPNYFASSFCQEEFDEYLARQAQRVAGHETLAAVYLVEVPEPPPSDIKRWREHMAAVQHVDMRAWFPQGVAALDREDVRQQVRILCSSLWERIDRAHRAATIDGNIPPLNPFFVGRTDELQTLHSVLFAGRVGNIAVVHGLGGMGKSELVAQYAHTFRADYPAGVWRCIAEGAGQVLPIIASLADDPLVGISVDPSLRGDPDATGRLVLRALRARAARAGGPALLILDNVSTADLLSIGELDLLDPDQQLVVAATTRLGPADFGFSRDGLTYVTVGELAGIDALRLIREHQPGEPPAFTSSDEEGAAGEIIDELQGFTLAVEQVAVFLGLPGAPPPSKLLAGLRERGSPVMDQQVGGQESVRAATRHRDKLVGSVLEQTLAQLAATTPAAVSALRFAALLPPDEVPWTWLHDLVLARHPEVATDDPFGLDPWTELRHRLEGRRLLQTTDNPQLARMHRLVSAHLMGPETQELHEALATTIAKLVDGMSDESGSAWQCSALAHTLLANLDADARYVEVASRAYTLQSFVTDGSVRRLAERVLSERRRAVAAAPDDVEGRCAEIEAICALQEVVRPSDPLQSLALSEEALGLSRGLHEQHPSDAAARDVFDTALGAAAETVSPRDPARGLALWEELVAIKQAWGEGKSNDPVARSNYAWALGGLANALESRDLDRARRTALESASIKLEILRRRAENAPGEHADRSVLNDERSIAAQLWSVSPAGARQLRETILVDARALAEAQPDNVVVQVELLDDMARLASALRHVAPERSVVLAEEVVAKARALAESWPANLQLRRGLALSLGGLAELHADRDPARARRLASEEVAILRELADLDPDNWDARRDLLLALSVAADLFREADGAQTTLFDEEALVVARPLIEMYPEDAPLRRTLVDLLRRVGRRIFLDGQGDPEATRMALRYYLEATQHSFASANAKPDDRAEQANLVVSYWGTASILDVVGDPSTRRDTWLAVVTVFERVERFGPLSELETRVRAQALSNARTCQRAADETLPDAQ